MKSPFPGMDPYLESHWGDVHTRLMVYTSNQINAQLPNDLQARVEEGLTLEIDEEATRTVYPDVSILEVPDDSVGGVAVETIATAEPLVLVLDDEPRTPRHIEIVDMSDGERLITAIEFLSPANKIGVAGRIAYLQKQKEYLDARVNLVEIDLIREGHHILSVPEERLPIDYRTPYRICVRRGNRPNRPEVYRAPLRHPLPNLRIPLRPTDRDIMLRLQPLLDECYRDGRYYRLDYTKEPTPHLSADDAQWADSLLRETGRRSLVGRVAPC
ncbi:MAG: DUF4058 family protein [Planctomycetales bacterium]